MDARKANDRIAEKAKVLRFVSRVPMLCECDTPGCRAVVMIGLEDYHEVRENASAFLVARGHRVSDSVLHTEKSGYAIWHAGREENGGRRSA